MEHRSYRNSNREIDTSAASAIGKFDSNTELTGLIIPLTSPQREIWFDQIVHNDVPLYNYGGYVQILGTVDPERFERAVNLLVQKHDCMRTILVEGVGEDGLPGQIFVDALEVEVPFQDFSNYEHPHVAALEWMQQQMDRPFALYSEKLFRYELLKIGPNCFYYLCVFHHIIIDGWGIASLLNPSLGSIYTALESGDRPDLTAPLYLDFIQNEHTYTKGAAFQRQRAYWTEKYQTLPNPLFPPMYRHRLTHACTINGCQQLYLNRSLYDRFATFAKENGVSTFQAILGVLYVYLARTCQQDDIAIGVPVLNRSTAAFKATAGMFVGVSPVRISSNTNQSFVELLQEINGVIRRDYRHQRFPISEVTRATRPLADHRNLFDVQISSGPPQVQSRFGSAVARDFMLHNSYSQLPLSLWVREPCDDSDVLIEFVYNKAYFDDAEMHALRDRLAVIFQYVLNNASFPIKSIPILPDAERTLLLETFNRTGEAYPQDRCIHELFEEQAAVRPNAIALVHQGETLTYEELNGRANRLAHHLIELGVVPDSRVALCVERSFDMMVGLLAILKAGGAYVPLDPAYPRERLAFMLKDSMPVAVLTHGAVDAGVRDMLAAACKGQIAGDDCTTDSTHSGSVQKTVIPLIDLTIDACKWAQNNAINQRIANLSPENLAYIIYTSGSTGIPKGVMVEHRNVHRLFSATSPWFSFNHDDVWALYHSFAFDFSVWEMWGALAHGGRLIIVPQLTSISPTEFYQLLCDESVTILNQTPSAFRQLIAVQGEEAQSHRLRHVIFGGEALEVAILKPWYQRRQNQQTQLINMYGITETTVHVTYRPLVPADADKRGASPIGCRIPDLKVYLLDDHGELVPRGSVGELYIGGAGVARSYLNREELTAERFLPDPFSTVAGARMYRTGDLARYLPDGNIEFLGRNDFQVKIRGFRIELGEIEAKLGEHAAVRDTVVVAQDDAAGAKRLVAYYTPARVPGGDAGIGEVPHARPAMAETLRTYLAALLPDYMIPAAYVCLDALPLTPNGKLDRKALPMPDGNAYAIRAYEPPVGEIETVLANIWAELLQVERVGRSDNFFELGGHSLLAVKLVGLLKRAGISITITQLFKNPTIELLTESMSLKLNESTMPEAIPVRTTGAKRPLFLLHEFVGLDLYFPVLAAHIDRDIPIYGLPGIPLDKPQLQTMESLATRLVRIIRMVQPSGAYRLAGWSFGGMLAYEVAKQLIEQGQSVEFLGLLDTYVPERKMYEETFGANSETDYLIDFVRMISVSTDDDGDFSGLEKLAKRLGYEELFHKFRESGVSIFQEYSNSEVKKYTNRMAAHLHATMNYRLHSLPIPIHLFAAEDQPSNAEPQGRDLLEIWKRAVPDQQFQYIVVPGNHYTMMTSPHLTIVGKLISDAITASF
ncbi:non-ribosomal peptide synthetase [Phyllobacterium sp. 22229]|uniref:non-ribosomal peptide synthetase n=1 Tax=Phyllobacterium sp. 22229 TaxID=3453895 RepID=UPI003F863A1A